MKFLSIAFYEFLKNVRDYKMAIILILFPIAMIWPVGNAMDSMLKEDITEKIKSGYVNNDDSAASKAFESFLKEKEISKRLDIIRLENEDQGMKTLTAGDIEVLILYPENTEKNLKEGKKQIIRLYGDEKLAYADSLIKTFTDASNAMNALVSAGGRPVAIKNTAVLKKIPSVNNAATPNTVSYYSVLILLQQLFLGALFGISITSRTPGSDIHIRIHALPVSGFSLTGGRVAGSSIYLLLASLSTILFSKYAYNANWNGNPGIIAGTMLIFCILVVGLGMLIGLLTKSFSMAMMATLLLMLLSGFIAGTFSPSSALTFMNEASPIYHAKILLFGTIYGYPHQIMLKAILWLSGQTLAVFGLVAFLSGRVRYDNI